MFPLYHYLLIVVGKPSLCTYYFNVSCDDVSFQLFLGSTLEWMQKESVNEDDERLIDVEIKTEAGYASDAGQIISPEYESQQVKGEYRGRMSAYSV